MLVKKTQRGFELIERRANLDEHGVVRLVQQSSAVGDYPDAIYRPGSSYLWIDEHHHLNREQVAELVLHLNRWLSNGHLDLLTQDLC